MSDLNSNNTDLFELIYNQQCEFQQLLLDKKMYEGFTKHSNSKLPYDDVELTSYHMQQLISEIGEVLATDKRWKNYRNDTSEEMLNHKKEELADCFIVLINLCLFSGLSAKDLVGAIIEKQNKNYIRIKSK